MFICSLPTFKYSFFKIQGKASSRLEKQLHKVVLTGNCCCQQPFIGYYNFKSQSSVNEIFIACC